jgi:ABC-type glutathione transport system ATPase component
MRQGRELCAELASLAALPPAVRLRMQRAYAALLALSTTHVARRTSESPWQRRTARRKAKALEAVRGIDLEVRRGEIFAFLGPNGAGKTTTVEILEGYRKRTGGEVRVLGTDPSTRVARGAFSYRSRVQFRSCSCSCTRSTASA